MGAGPAAQQTQCPLPPTALLTGRERHLFTGFLSKTDAAGMRYSDTFSAFLQSVNSRGTYVGRSGSNMANQRDDFEAR